MQDVEILKLLSVTLTRDKQTVLEEEIQRYAAATNWVIKQILKQRFSSRLRAIETLHEEFSSKYDARRGYLDDVLKTAGTEIRQHRKLAKTIRTLRDKTPFFRPGRLIFSQPIIRLDDKAVTIILNDRNLLPIPFDKRSRNRFADKLSAILKSSKKDGEINNNYSRIRVTLHKEGFADIDIQAKKLHSMENYS